LGKIGKRKSVKKCKKWLKSAKKCEKSVKKCKKMRKSEKKCAFLRFFAPVFWLRKTPSHKDTRLRTQEKYRHEKDKEELDADWRRLGGF